ncbi:hypothetical protein HQ865_08265 [Mucilaginibacter mali]|uniref:Aspartyl protease n=1 Tax=Mucilaginibacter mali TaxID=2740462 RepID=A0A7D4QEM6_9SPHI|nr:hypothetical protein [Mucilaginibacter mali]QKJ29752.1 hypothetical protein HQ865_08265 [Mucilaginibacter mali]
MKRLFLYLPILFAHTLFAQSKLPVIRATAKSVSVKDGEFLNKNSWTLTPSARPDVFTADRTREAKYVTFYTDIDSIRVQVKPGTRYNFVILLNGKDSCFTQVASAIPPEDKFKNVAATHDTIPFTLTTHDAIAVKAVINNTDTLMLHLDLSSFDVHLTRDAILKKTHLLVTQPDAIAGKVTPNFNKMAKVTRLQMGQVVFTDPPVSTTGSTAHEMDGRFAWNLFEGKTIELDYDKSLIIIHNNLAKIPKGYQRSKLIFNRSNALVRGSFKIDGKVYTGNFSMDTGSETAMIVDSGWVGKQHLPVDRLKLIKSMTFSDPQNRTFQSNVVLTPSYTINNFPLGNVPALILSSKINPAGYELNFLGNDLLKRFNMLLDLKNDFIYLKPNHLIDVKYKQSS